MEAKIAFSKTRLSSFRTCLLNWFSREQRDLPWRKRRTPYRVWISECMLQQTRVDTVVEYYRRWMKRFPSLRKLAEAEESDVLKAWEGLGYYSRARNLHRAAQQVCREHGGRLPRTAEDLRTLPGIGPYSAAAIASLCHDEPVAVLDGNVIRVLSRLFCIGGDPSKTTVRKEFMAAAQAILDPDQPGMFNEAMMELGATVCLPGIPKCGECPVHTHCTACRKSVQDRYPEKKKRKPVPHKTVGAGVIFNRRGQVLLAKRPADKMLGGLWEFPGGVQESGESLPQCIQRELKEELGIEVEVTVPLTVVQHAYSHFTIELHAWCGRIRKGRPRCIECADYAWVRQEDICRYALSKADITVANALKQDAAAANVARILHESL